MAGTGGEGVFVSRDGGATGTPSSAGLTAGWVHQALGRRPERHAVAQLSTRLYRRDGGSAWTAVTEPFTTEGKADIDGILFDSTSPQIVHAFDASKYWRSTDGGRRWQEAEHQGPSMRDMMKGKTDTAQFASIAQDPGNAKTLYAGSSSNDTEGGAVYKTVDAGKKWAPSGAGLPPKKVGLLRSGAPGTLFAVVEGHGLYRTTNGGGSWSAANSGLPDGKVKALAVSPKNPSQLFAATEKGLLRSTDAGASWARVGAAPKAGIEGDDIEAVAIDPTTGTVYAGGFRRRLQECRRRRQLDAPARWPAAPGRSRARGGRLSSTALGGNGGRQPLLDRGAMTGGGACVSSTLLVTGIAAVLLLGGAAASYAKHPAIVRAESAIAAKNVDPARDIAPLLDALKRSRTVDEKRELVDAISDLGETNDSPNSVKQYLLQHAPPVLLDVAKTGANPFLQGEAISALRGMGVSRSSSRRPRSPRPTPTRSSRAAARSCATTSSRCPRKTRRPRPVRSIPRGRKRGSPISTS